MRSQGRIVGGQTVGDAAQIKRGEELNCARQRGQTTIEHPVHIEDIGLRRSQPISRVRGEIQNVPHMLVGIPLRFR
jgi:hypothetical protein